MVEAQSVVCLDRVKETNVRTERLPKGNDEIGNLLTTFLLGILR